MNELLDLYVTFMRIGCVTFGGGYAMLPILERELVDKRQWTTMDDLRDYFSIGQCTPGIIALNVSTFIGEKKAGVPGALCATTGFLTGPITIILIIASFLTNFADLPIVQHAFAGIRVCVCVLILQAILRLWKSSVVDAFTLCLYLVIFVLNAFSGVLPVKIPAAVLVIAAGVTGVVVSMIKRKKLAGAGDGSGTDAGAEGAGAGADFAGSGTDAGADASGGSEAPAGDGTGSGTDAGANASGGSEAPAADIAGSGTDGDSGANVDREDVAAEVQSADREDVTAEVQRTERDDAAAEAQRADREEADK